MKIMNIFNRAIRKAYIYFTRVYFQLFRSDVRIGKNLNFRGNLSLNSTGGGITISIGNNVFFNRGCRITAHKSIVIGDDCIFGEDVKIYDHNHSFNKAGKLIREQGYSCKEVYIGSNCWIGSNVVILAGANIGDNSVIGAGCIISGDVPQNSIVKRSENLKFDRIVFK